MIGCFRHGRRSGWMVAVAVTAMIVGVPGYPAGAQWMLRPLWSDVTPGRVTVEPWGVGSGEDAAVAVVTEDRHIRLRNFQGTVVAAARTGLRDPVGVLQEGPYHALLIPPRDSRARLLRIDLYGNQPQAVGQPIAAEEVIAEDARFVAVDGESLVYTVSSTGLVTHASTAGGVLWERWLPAPPSATLTHRGAVYAALADGRVFRFDGNGTGIELFRLSAPVVAMSAIESSPSALLVLDREGMMSLFHVTSTLDAHASSASDSGMEVSISWQVHTRFSDAFGPGDNGAVATRLTTIPGRGAGEEWSAVVSHHAGGITIVGAQGSIRSEAVLPDIPIDVIRAGRLPSGGILVLSGRQLHVLSSGGIILDRVELRQVPSSITWIDVLGQLIVTYRDWSIEAWTVVSALETREAVPPRSFEPAPRGRRQVNAPSPGALTARAEAVFAGNSRTERRTLLREIRGQRTRAVLFNRVGEARSILQRLVRETLEAPDVGEGRIRNNFPEIRRAAVEELGFYMDRTSRNVLTDVVRYDPDQQVAAAAMRAIARYGVDEAGITAYGVARFRRADDRGRLVLAPAMIELLELTSTGQRYPTAAEDALDLLIESNLSRDIRRRAATIERERYR